MIVIGRFETQLTTKNFAWNPNEFMPKISERELFNNILLHIQQVCYF